MPKPQTQEIRSTIQKRDAKGEVRHGAEWLALWSDPSSVKSRQELREEREMDTRRRQMGHNLSAAARAVSEDATYVLALEEAAKAAGIRLSGEMDPLEMAALRGQVDALALLLRYHDADIHAAVQPQDEGERRLFDLLEQIRCEALGIRRFPGIGDNIRGAHWARLQRLDLNKAHLASLVPLAEALRMVVRDTLTGQTEPSIDSAGFRMWDQWLRARLSGELAALKGHIGDQAGYAKAAKHLIHTTFEALSGRAEGPDRLTPTPNDGSASEAEGDAAQSDEEGEDIRPGDSLFADDAPPFMAELLRAAEAAAPPPPYKIYTRQYDEVLRADTLGKARDLRTARHRMEEKRAEYRRELAHLVIQLQRRLMALQRRSWTFDLEEGLIDASRLDRVIVNPGFSDAYKAEEESRFRDTAVTLLIDNSGSMRGKPIELACIAADMISAALEKCGVAAEVLGFTTVDWKGGKPAKDWAREGRPADPGRLNALRHIIYKSADEPLRHARNALCVMLSDGLLKENIDGEALIWASRRLSQRPEARRVLIVISDGAPVDQATLEANSDPRILDQHLRETIAQIERSGQIELAALGIKHDVDSYYSHAVRVDRAEDMGRALVDLLDSMIVR